MINKKGQFVEVPVMNRILSKIIVQDNGCWIWIKGVTKRSNGTEGRPLIKYKGKNVVASHCVLECYGRPRPSKFHIDCHTCDTPRCMNPAHLWWGTFKENTQDAIKKNRGVGKWKSRMGKLKVGKRLIGMRSDL